MLTLIISGYGKKVLHSVIHYDIYIKKVSIWFTDNSIGQACVQCRNIGIHNVYIYAILYKFKGNTLVLDKSYKII